MNINGELIKGHIGNILVDSIQGKNLFNKNNVNVGRLYSNGSIGTSTADDLACRYSDYISITRGNKVTISGINTADGGNLIEYNANKEKIDNWNTSNRTITLNSNTKFVRMSIKSNDLDTAQLEYGDSATIFSEFQGIGYVSGKNSNGSYIKYDDGTLICYKLLEINNVAINTPWAGMYETNIGNGNYPYNFIETPCISVTPYGSGMFIEQGGESASATSWGNTTVVRPVSGNVNVKLYLLAIGRWK